MTTVGSPHSSDADSARAARSLSGLNPALVIVGAGPAGLAPLFAAARAGILQQVLSRGVVILERGGTPGAGALRDQAVTGDSYASTFVEIVTQSKEPRLRDLSTHPLTRLLLESGRQAMPLGVVADFMQLASGTLSQLVQESANSRLLCHVEVLRAQQEKGGGWCTTFRDLVSGAEAVVRSRALLVATGAHQPEKYLARQKVAGFNLAAVAGNKLVQSGRVLQLDGMHHLRQRLQGGGPHSFAIVGGSSSAITCALRISEELPDLAARPTSIQVLHRRPLRLFYESVEEALAAGYTAFQPRDVCPLTGRVHRLGGLRLRAGDLLKRIWGLSQEVEDGRIRLMHLPDHPAAEVRRVLQKASVVVAALGYRPGLMALLAEDGSTIRLVQPRHRRWSVVDEHSRVAREDGSLVEGVFAIGIAVGPAASKALGGERRFTGQVNSLWLWQNTIGLSIVRQVLQMSESLHVSPVPFDRSEMSLPTKKSEDRQDERSSPSAEHGFGEHGQTRRIPFILPEPPRLSECVAELKGVEASGVFSNYGPVNTLLEAELSQVFRGRDRCLTVCNATAGLMLAIKEVMWERSPKAEPASPRYALMPSFTFAATAHAAQWCGLTPLFCDVDPETWLPSQTHQEDLLRRFHGQIAVVVPCATFGNVLDLEWYEDLSRRFDVPIVVDAAAGFGSLDRKGRALGTDFGWPVVFSMHATKAFSIGEGGFIHCADSERIRRLRAMGSFGFVAARHASLPGLNAKLSEVSALLAREQLKRFPKVIQRCSQRAAIYCDELMGGMQHQHSAGTRMTQPFYPVLLPEGLASERESIRNALLAANIETGAYFSPHLAEQSMFPSPNGLDELSETESISKRIVCLPLLSASSENDIRHISATLTALVAERGVMHD